MTTGAYRSVPARMRSNTEPWIVALGRGGTACGTLGCNSARHCVCGSGRLRNKRQVRPQMRRRPGELGRVAARVVVDVEQPALLGFPRHVGGAADIALIPDHRTEGVAFLFERQRVAGAVDLRTYEVIRH